MYLLDTDTIIYNLKGHEAVKRNLQRHIEDLMKISIITLMELYYGAHKSEKVPGNLAKVKRLETESAGIFGMLKATLENSGTRLDDFDLIIASCAMAHNLTLVTNNIGHFKRIEGLRLTNWDISPDKI